MQNKHLIKSLMQVKTNKKEQLSNAAPFDCEFNIVITLFPTLLYSIQPCFYILFRGSNIVHFYIFAP